MRRVAGLAAVAVLLVGCAPAALQPAAHNATASSVREPATARGYVEGSRQTQGSDALPSMPWPKFQAGRERRADEAELAIVLRCHELRERHPSATPSELAEMLARDDVWKQNAPFVESARRAYVIREALALL